MNMGGSGNQAAPAGMAHTVAQEGPFPGVKNQGDGVAMVPDVSFTLKTNVGEKGLSFIGVGGNIDGQLNPKLQVAEGAVVQITLINGDGALHDVVFPDFQAATEQVVGQGSSSSTVFKASKSGTFAYYCSIPGHRQAGMEGQLVVGQAQAVEETGADIVRDPADVPAPIGDRAAQNVRIDLETVEVKGQLANGTTYNYWTFNGTVPGPMLRVRVGDTVEVHLKNNPGSQMIHSVDFHAVTGPGGGATVTQVPPGQEKTFTFKALNPGVYVYHCATPMVAHHISNGMYGLIVVEPEGGLPKVDKEFYVMQGEIYTQAPFGQQGFQAMSVDKLLAEQPEYMTFNGAVGALTDKKPLKANVGADGADLLRRRRTQQGVVVPRDRRDLRPGVRRRLADHAAADGRADDARARGWGGGGRVQAPGAGPLRAGRPQPEPDGARAGGLPATPKARRTRKCSTRPRRRRARDTESNLRGFREPRRFIFAFTPAACLRAAAPSPSSRSGSR